MEIIYKYPVVGHDQWQLLPKGAQVLKIDLQHGHWQIWAIVNPKSPMESRRFRIYATGQAIVEPQKQLKFINTVFEYGGTCVWHAFELLGEVSK